MRKIYTLFIIIYCTCLSCLAQETSLIINEIQVCNTDLIIDPSYNYGAWIELYNPSSSEIKLSGLYISNDESTPKKHKLSSSIQSVPAGGFRAIWFDHNSQDGNYGGKSSSQVRFKLDVEGGMIFLTDANGNRICEATYPPGIPRCSYARIVDGGEEWGTTGNPTPETTNTTSVFHEERYAAPTISSEGGVFEQGDTTTFKVTIPSYTTLVYTTDGSTPTMTNGRKITKRANTFTVSETTIYRFACFGDNALPSPVLTRSFIFKKHNYYLPIISISTNYKNLYDDIIGIYCVGTNGISGRGVDSPRNWNMDWERPVNVEYMVPKTNSEGETSFITYINQEVDMEICGGWSRAYGGGTVDGRKWEAKSSFRLKCDKEYEGINALDYPVFPHKPYNKYKVWQVRNGGNDTYARIHDMSIGQIAIQSNFDLDAQDGQAAHIFFNGKYLGMLNIRESNNRHYGYSNWGIDTDDMDQFELSGGYHQMVGTETAWKEVVTNAKTLSSNPTETNYQKVCEGLDIDEFVNYMAYCIYMGPWDWMDNANNMKAYRSVSDNGKFRFVLFDMDSAMDGDDDPNMINKMMSKNFGSNVDDLFRYLMTYPPFRQKFVDAYCLVDGSLFAPERCSEIITKLYDERLEALSFEGNSPSTSLISRIQKAHNGTRMTHLQSVLSLEEPYKLKISSNLPEAHLVVNEQIIPTGEFKGFLYPAEGRLQLTAQAPAGYTFTGWNVISDVSEPSHSEKIFTFGSTWEYYDQGSLDGVNWTALDFDAYSNGWQKGDAPLAYANSGRLMDQATVTRLDYGGDANNKRPTYYFRHKFFLDEKPTSNEAFRFNYKVDDGLRLYVNGKDIDGFRVDKGAKYDFRCSDWAGDQPDQGTFIIDPADLEMGWNIVAVEVHNNSATSSDIFWDGEIVHLFYEAEDFNQGFADESINLPDMLETGNYIVTANFTPITDQQQLLSEGVTPIRINEVSAGNDIYINEYGKKNDWIELYNTTNEEIDVAGMYLSDDIGNPQKWQISAFTSINTNTDVTEPLPIMGEMTKGQWGSVIPPHGTLVVWCDKQDPITQLHAPFKLDNADGAVVTIQAKDGSWTDCLEYLKQPHRQTFGRFPDGSNYTTLMNWPTINRSNLLSAFFHEDYTFPDNDITGPTAITLVDAQIVSRQYYNLQGQRINHPQGICIEKILMSDGSTKTRKILR